MNKYKKYIIVFFFKMFGFIGFNILGCILSAQGLKDCSDICFILGTGFGLSLFFGDIK